MEQDLFAGLDVSTQSCKLVVIDLADKATVHIDAVRYDTDLPQFQTRNGVIPGLEKGASESDPRMWLEAVSRLFGRLQASEISQENIRCLAVSGQQHGLVALDADGELSRPRSKLWNDFSTQLECALLTEAVGGPAEMIREVGNSQRTGYTAAKIFHMRRREPEAYAKTSTFFLVHNYINWFLTGGVISMEPGDTSGMALWNPATGSWSEAVIAVIDPDLPAKLPQVKPSDESIGHLSSTLAQRFGLSRECRIDAGSGDNMYGAVGTGNVRPGILTVSLGTSGTAYTLVPEPFIDPEGEIAAFRDSTGQHLPLLCVSNMANGYNAFLEEHKVSHAEFERMASRASPGNGGRLLIPWYTGERTPDLPQAAPLNFGFALSDFSPEILSRAVLDGHVLNLSAGFRRMPVKPEEIRLTGGLSQSGIWAQAIADFFEAEVVPVEGEGAALGAALHAAWVWLKESGRPRPLEALTSDFVIMRNQDRKMPIPRNLPARRLQTRLYHALTERLRGREGEDPFRLHHQLAGMT